MDVFFQPTKGRSFVIEVGYFDTILEIKDKIQRDQGIPIPKQTLIFKGNVLDDHLNVHYSDILDRSHIQLVVESELPDKNNAVKVEQQPSSSFVMRKIQLILKMPTSKLSVAAEVTDSIWKVKEIIHESEGVHMSKLAMHSNGIELMDHKSLQDYEISDNSEIDVSIKPSTIIVSTPPSPTTTATVTTTPLGSSVNNGNGSKKLRIMILTKCGTKKIPIEVNPSDNVGHLKKDLQKLELDLPQEGYFFIYKQNVMDDDRSFRWHHVCQGDTIEIFNGSVTGGV